MESSGMRSVLLSTKTKARCGLLKFANLLSPLFSILAVVCWCSLLKVNPLQGFTNLIFYFINPH